MERRKREIRPSRLQAWGITVVFGGFAALLYLAWSGAGSEPARTGGPVQGLPRWLVVPVVIALAEAALIPWGLREWHARRGRLPEARYIVTGFLLSWVLATLYVVLR